MEGGGIKVGIDGRGGEWRGATSAARRLKGRGRPLRDAAGGQWGRSLTAGGAGRSSRASLRGRDGEEEGAGPARAAHCGRQPMGSLLPGARFLPGGPAPPGGSV